MEAPRTDTRQDAAPEPSLSAQEAREYERADSKRTPGLYIFDVFLYPFLMHGLVTALSTYMTYQTTFGEKHEYDEHGEITHRGSTVGNWLRVRGDWTRDKANDFLKMFDEDVSGMDDADVAIMDARRAKTAKNLVMVLYSFVDGTLLAPVVKLFEDHRSDIAHWIDKQLGTVPDNPEEVYGREPKQTWGSIILGRLAVALVVAPTAIALNEPTPFLQDEHGKQASWNDLLFERQGRKFAHWLNDKHPGLKEAFSAAGGFEGADQMNEGERRLHKMEKLAETVTFEGFYTMVCIVGLYVVSRAIAAVQGKDAEPVAEAPAASVVQAAAAAEPVPVAETPESAPASRKTPSFVPPKVRLKDYSFTPDDGLLHLHDGVRPTLSL